MITSTIQLAALAFFLLFSLRLIKQDRLAELRKREELQDLFKTQQSFISKSILEPLRAISVDEVKYMERQTQILKRIEYFGELIEVYVTQDAISKDEFTRLHQCVSDNNVMLSQIRILLQDIPSIKSIESIQSIVEATSCRLESLQSTADSTHSELIALKPLIQDLIKARTENLIKDGEANRTLRRRLQESALTLNSVKANLRDKEALVKDLKDQIQKLSSLESQLKELEKDKAYHEAAADLLAEELTHFQTQTRAQLAALHMPAEEIERIFSSINQNVQKLMNPTAPLDAACQ